MMNVVHVRPAHRQLGFQLRVVGPEAELHAASGVEVLYALQQFVSMRFTNAVGMKTLQVDRRRRAGAGEDAGDYLLLQHAAHLARHAGGEEEAGLADVQRETAGGADRVVDHLGGGGQHRLLDVIRRHDAGALGEKRLHDGQPFLVQRQFHPGGLGGDFLRQIVHGRAEAAVHDHRVGARSRQLEGGEQGIAVVAHGGFPVDGQADIFQLLRHVTEVGVGDLAAEHLVAGADDLDAHGFPRSVGGRFGDWGA
jgi:hypothetical protein